MPGLVTHSNAFLQRHLPLSLDYVGKRGSDFRGLIQQGLELGGTSFIGKEFRLHEGVWLISMI